MTTATSFKRRTYEPPISSRTVTEVPLAGLSFGEIMMQRVFPDRVVDAVARALEPLPLGWFYEPPARDA